MLVAVPPGERESRDARGRKEGGGQGERGEGLSGDLHVQRMYVGASSAPFAKDAGCSMVYIRPTAFVLPPVLSSRGSWSRECASLTYQHPQRHDRPPVFRGSPSTRGQCRCVLRPPPRINRKARYEMGASKCALALLALAAVLGSSSSSSDEGGFLDKGYRALYRVYEECQHRNVAVSPCLKKKAIAFFERLGRIQTLPIAENLELVRMSEEEAPKGTVSDLETTLGRTTGGNREEFLNEALFDRAAALMNSFNVQIRLPKTSAGELKRSIEEGRGKMKKMMGMMMMGMAMKMAALVPIAMGVLFLLAGKALIISKIALVLSLIIGLKKLLSQKQSHDHHSGWQQGGGGGWDRSLRGSIDPTESAITVANNEYAQNLAYSARHLH
ncbi:hypothetical protein KM043_006777 [Ampulex compressa]|nr:hypothetical protein KM043_006777 [Ampulex compressa]